MSLGMRRSIAIFIFVSILLSISLAFQDEGHLYRLGDFAFEDFDDLKDCWVTSFQEMSLVDKFWTYFNSMPPTFIVATSATLVKLGMYRGLETKDLKNLQDRLFFSIYVLLSDRVHHLPEDIVDWWPDIDPITGEELESSAY